MSVAESEWRPSGIETCRIINVNIDDWSVDCIAEYGNKRYFDLQVMAPYFHFANGEGIYAQPEVGALCWVCTPSAGRFAAPFVMGFQSAHDEDFDGFRGGRLTLNPGDIMMRTRDENFIILRRGGVLQMGSTPTCQTMYVPIGNMLRHFCEQFELNTFGGELVWDNARTDQTDSGAVLSKLQLKLKRQVNTSKYDVELQIGSHGGDDPTRLSLVVNDSGLKDNKPVASLAITNEGDLGWTLEKSFGLEVKDSIIFYSKEGTITVLTDQGDISLQSAANMTLKADGGDFNAEASANATVKAGAVATLDGPTVNLGANATSPIIKGDQFVSFMTTFITQLSTLTSPISGAPIVAAPALASLTGQLSGLLSTVSFTK